VHDDSDDERGAFVDMFEIQHKTYMCPLETCADLEAREDVLHGRCFYKEQFKTDMARDPAKIKPFDAHAKPDGYERPLMPYSFVCGSTNAVAEEEDAYMRGRFVPMVFGEGLLPAAHGDKGTLNLCDNGLTTLMLCSFTHPFA
jgi:hypothetical protein